MKNLEESLRFITDPPIEDIQIATQGQGRDILYPGPGVSDLLVIHSGSKCPRRDRFAILHVPQLDGVIRTARDQVLAIWTPIASCHFPIMRIATLDRTVSKLGDSLSVFSIVDEDFIIGPNGGEETIRVSS